MGSRVRSLPRKYKARDLGEWVKGPLGVLSWVRPLLACSHGMMNAGIIRQPASSEPARKPTTMNQPTYECHLHKRATYSIPLQSAHPDPGSKAPLFNIPKRNAQVMFKPSTRGNRRLSVLSWYPFLRNTKRTPPFCRSGCVGETKTSPFSLTKTRTQKKGNLSTNR